LKKCSSNMTPKIVWQQFNMAINNAEFDDDFKLNEKFILLPFISTLKSCEHKTAN
jgi:hypothetical protein